jgi:VanZ family protein
MSRFLLGAGAAALIVLSGPYVGELNTRLQNAFPDQHLRLVVAVVVMPALLALGGAVARIRELRALRYGAIILAIALAVGYAAILQPIYTEQFHLTEYGVLTVLFYRVWRHRGDTTTFVLPVAAALVTGIADEWFQWFVPSRVGELRDVALNGVGILSGLLFACALAPPSAVRAFADDRSRRLLAGGLAFLVAAFALFLQSVHLGYRIVDPAIGTFSSLYDVQTLTTAAEERARRWSASVPAEPERRIAREDHYLSEAMYHVRRRNDAVAQSDLHVAWRENLILERYYEPVLLYASPASRWPVEQRAQIAAALAAAAPGAAPPADPFVSDAYPLPIYAWSRLWLWGVTGLVFLGLAALARPRAQSSAVPAVV